MNGPFVVAQANTGGSSAAPVQVLKLIKPQAGQTDIMHASFTGSVKIDFTAIANEKITLFHDSKNQSLHVIFADGSQIIIEPFFDSRGTVLSNLLFEMGPNQFYGGEEFAQKFPITEDQTVLPAAGDAVTSGADFHDPSVDPLLTGPPLDLLPPEELPGLQFTNTATPLLPVTEAPVTVIPGLGAPVLGIVEEEQIPSDLQFSDAGQGNEDTLDAAASNPPPVDGSGNDKDVPGNFDNTTNQFVGTLAGLVVGGSLPLTFNANSLADLQEVRDSNNELVTSLHSQVYYVFVSPTQIEGWTFDGDPANGGTQLNRVFTLEVGADGAFTFTLTDQIDHHVISHDDGTNPQGIFEETLFLDLSQAITAHGATPDAIVFPANSFDMGVIDDTPVTFETSPIYPQADVEGPVSQALDDEEQPGGVQGGPGDDGFGKQLSGFLDISYGTDGPSHYENGIGTNPLVFSATNILVTDSNGDPIPLNEFNAVYVDANGIGTQHVINISWTDGAFGGGTLTGTADDGNGGTFDVFELVVQPGGSYTFTLNAPLAHPFNADGQSVNTVSEFEDNLHIQLTYTATDFDLDTVDGHVTINVDDDVPTIVANESQDSPAIVLDESVGNDGSNPGDSLQANPPGDDTGNPAPTFPLPTAHVDNPVAFGSATIDGATIGNLFAANAGADGEGSHEYTLVLRDADGTPTGIGNAFVQTNLSITDFTATGNATPVYGDDTIYLFQVSAHQINGVVAGVDGNINTEADNQFAFRIVIDPNTGAVTVDQYLAIHHPDAGDTPLAYDDLVNMFVVGEGESGGVFVNYNLTDGDGDSAGLTADTPLSISFEDDGIGVDVALAPAQEGPGNAQLAGLVLDESIGGDVGGNGNGALDDNPGVTAPSYITAANSALAIGITSTEPAAGAGTSISELFTVTKSVGTDGLLNEQKNYSLTLTDDSGDPVLAGSNTGVLTNLHVTEVNGSPVDGFSAGNRAVYLFKVSDTEIVGLIGQDTPGNGDDYVALRILLDVTNPADPILRVEQYLALEHPLGGPSNFDESIFLNFADTESGNASLSVTLSDTVTDGDGDTATDSESVTLASAADSNTQSGSSLISFEDDGLSASNTSPTITINNETIPLVLDDEGQPLGQFSPDAPEDVDVPEAAKVATGTLPITAGTDGLTSISVATNVTTTDSAGLPGTVSIIYVDPSHQDKGTAEAVTFAWVPNASGGGDLIGTSAHYDGVGLPAAIVLHVNIDGTYTLTMNAPLDHPYIDSDFNNTGGPEIGYEDNLILNFSYTATDGDTDTAPAVLSVNVDDDKPVDFTPESAFLGNSPGSLNFALHVFGHTGADGLGAVVFTGIANGAIATGTPQGSGVPLTSGGQQIYLYFGSNGADHTVLIGSTVTPLEFNNGGGINPLTEAIFQVSLNPDAFFPPNDTYTVQVFAPIDHGAGVPVDLSFGLLMTDGDGDGVTSTVQIELEPAGNPLVQTSAFNGIVEEEQLGHVANPIYLSSFTGNEDQTATPDNDLDTADSGPGSLITREFVAGSYGVTGGTGPYTFHFDASLEGAQAQFADAPFGVTSHGDPVLLHFNGNTLFGYTNVGGAGYTEGVDHVVFTYQITDASTGAATFTLYDNLDHHTVAAADNVEGTRSLNLNGIVQVTDSSPSAQTISLNGSVGVIDDIPVATNNTASVGAGGNSITDLMLIIDTSASMGEDPGVPGFATRLDLEKAALINLLNSANVDEVFIVSFNTNATDSGAWLSVADAITYINGLTAKGLTNYDDALAHAETAFTFAHTPADQTLSYFLSDGVPTWPFGSIGIDASEQATWESFLTTNGIAESFAVGVGPDANLIALQPVAFPNGDPNNPILLTDQSLILPTLPGMLPGTVTGNVLIDDSGFGVDGFGADGRGAGGGIVSITVDGHVYAYDSVANAIAQDGVPLFTLGSTLSIDTALSGHLIFHFADGAGFAAGDWQYLSPASVNVNTVETFHYVIADGDGDQAGADLAVTIFATNQPPVAGDDAVITNISGAGAAIAIPDLALLLNDTDPDGPSQTIASVGSGVGGSASHVNLVTTFTDGAGETNGGSFDYTVQDLGSPNLTDSGHVTVDRAQAGENQLDGTSASEILIGRAGTSDTLIGGAGNDVLFGNTGADHFRYNAPSEGLDHILDFNTAEGDVIDILASAFGGGLTAGTDATGIFGSSVNNDFSSPTERFHFNTLTHTLLYDSNGSAGGGTQVALAVLENNGSVDAAHIHMV